MFSQKLNGVFRHDSIRRTFYMQYNTLFVPLRCITLQVCGFIFTMKPRDSESGRYRETGGFSQDEKKPYPVSAHVITTADVAYKV